ncbi:MAG: hypothetical protein EGQ71_03745, partial [Dialister sp.]|nr:hypothetical protein [Dialister sp.]
AIGACQRPSNNVGYTVVLPPQPSGQLPRWGAKNVLPLNLIALLGYARDDDGAKRCQNSAALSMIMRRTAPAEPAEPVEPAPPLSQGAARPVDEP